MPLPVLAIVLGAVAVGGVAGWVLGDEHAQKKLAAGKKALAKKAEGLRLPEPSIAMELPDSADDFRILEDIVSSCVAQAQGQTWPETATLHDAIVYARDCALKALYPNFPWPPMVGDHASVQILWTIIEYETAKRLVLASEEQQFRQQTPFPR